MPDPTTYDYAIIRVVPGVERGECLNVGVILFCRTRRFLGVLMHLDTVRLLALAPRLDLAEVRRHLETIELICAGDVRGGSIAALSLSERFHWLVAPRSTIIQTSPVHSGLSSSPEAALRRLLATMVLVEE